MKARPALKAWIWRTTSTVLLRWNALFHCSLNFGGCSTNINGIFPEKRRGPARRGPNDSPSQLYPAMTDSGCPTAAKIPERKPKCFSGMTRVFAASVRPPSPFCHMPGVLNAMKARQVKVMPSLTRHRHWGRGASRMVPEPRAVAFGNEPGADDGRCRRGSRLRKARSGKDRNQASEGERLFHDAFPFT